MVYRGVIIEESLEDKSILSNVIVISKKVERATKEHKTPWARQWTLDTVEIPENKAKEAAEKISKAIDSKHKGSWFADFRNGDSHYIIFRDKIFFVDMKDKKRYAEVTKFGISLGIPAYQLDFSSEIKA